MRVPRLGYSSLVAPSFPLYRSMFRTYLTTALAVVLATPIWAQAQQTQGVLAPTRTAGTYSMTQGFQPAGPIAPRIGPNTLFDNIDGDEVYFSIGYGGAAGVTSWSPDDEVIDQAAFPQVGLSGREQLNGFLWSYCSNVLDPAGTQDVLPIDIRFYEDYDPLGTGSPTTWPIALCEYAGNFPGGDAAGNILCWDITFDAGFGLECSLPQELNPGVAEPFGVGWQYNDPALYPAGLTGPVVDAVHMGNPLGYGALDESKLHDRTNGVYVGGLFGGTPKFQDSRLMTLFGLPTDTVAYYHVNPGTGAFEPAAGDTLQLEVDGPVGPGTFVTYSVTDPNGASSYILIPALAPADAPVVLGASALAATRLLSSTQLLPPTKWVPMGIAGQTPLLSLPPVLPFTQIFVQAVEYTGVFNLQNATAASNGLKSAW